MDLSPERLVRVLTEAKVKPHKKILALCQGSLETWRQCAAERMTRSLPAIAHRHRVRQAQQPAVKEAAMKQLRKVRDGLDVALRALDAVAPNLQDLLDAIAKPAPRSAWGRHSATVHEQIETMRGLRGDVESARLAFASCGLISTKEIQTYLYSDVSALYYELTGRAEIGGDKGGPLYRFVKQCIALIDPDAIPEPSAFRKALQRQRTETTKKVGHTLD
jgi:hypothetical protein